MAAKGQSIDPMCLRILNISLAMYWHTISITNIKFDRAPCILSPPNSRRFISSIRQFHDSLHPDSMTRDKKTIVVRPKKEIRFFSGTSIRSPRLCRLNFLHVRRGVIWSWCSCPLRCYHTIQDIMYDLPGVTVCLLILSTT